MAEVLGGLSDRFSRAVVVTYSDNLGVFTPEAEAEAIEDHLRRAFRSTSVGPFDLTFSPRLPITNEFKFLGHHWRLHEGELRTYVPTEIADARGIALGEQLLRSIDSADRRKVRGYIKAQVNEWKLWPGVVEWEAELLNLLQSAEPTSAACIA
jgi:hypothetical protein